MSEKLPSFLTNDYKRRKLGVLVGAIVITGVISFGRWARAFRYLLTTAERSPPSNWEDLGLAPDGENKYPPQGMVHTPDGLYFTNHWNNQKSGLYRLDPDSGDVEADQFMPDEATHTSGLAWDGEWLWALDHGSNRLYKIDPTKLFEESKDAFAESYTTGLTAASALTKLTVEGTDYLAISDFVWSIQPTIPLPIGNSKTYLIKLNQVSNLRQQKVPEIATLEYPNGGYSQGLTYDGTYLYEAINNRGVDSIQVMDINDAITGEAPVETIGSFAGPATRIEDLGNDGTNLWTSDEGTYHLYKLDSLSTIRNQL